MSELRADTITASDGTSPVTLTKQEAAKARLMYDQFNVTIDGGFNISSVQDVSTGTYQPSFTSNVSLGFATTASFSNTSSGQNDCTVRGFGNSITTQATTGYRVLTYTSTTAYDDQLNGSITVGDLA